VQPGEYRSFTLKLAADADHHTSLSYDPYTSELTLLAVVDKNFDAVFVQQDTEFERTVLAADLAAAAVHDVGTGTGIAAIQHQLGV